MIEPRGGDFGDFARAHWPALWRTAWLLTGDAHAAEDLAQTALEQTWPHDGRLSSDDQRRAYLHRVIVHSFIRDSRRRWHREIPTADQPEQTSLEDVAGLAGERDAMRAALAALPARQRAGVVLRYFADLSEVQTAAAMGCSVGSVKTHVRRALTALRRDERLHALAGENLR